MAARFKNLDGSLPHALGNVFKWAVGDKLAGKRRKSPDTAPVRRVEPDLASLATPPAVGEGARLTWLGHASWLVQLDGVSLLIDPALRDTITGFIRRNVGPGVPMEKLPPITATLVSHNHFDHLDMPTVRQVGAPVVSGLGMARYFRPGSPPITELDWWGSTQVGPVTVHFVPAQHWSRRGLNDVNETLWGGFVVQGSSACVYHSGDTAYFDGFKEIGRRFPAMDAAMLPIGAYDPGWFMEKQHMNPEQAVQAYEDLGARRFLAMHWGTFKLTDEPLDEPPQRLDSEWGRRKLPREPLHVLAVGESLSVRRAG
ncbi:MBL fold metallo-hydrolase [Archangium violaceum]|uniref:MBL fold metallo-hydrolase n=1 Tax=Archangium violaceum TaxID=83451 RepID=UPI002B2915E0|nr:MBL fold metallo-hydrolase [Archangium gephyra]